MTSSAGSSPRVRGHVRIVVRWAIGVIFLVAGLLKLWSPENFYNELLAYAVPLPDGFFRLTAVVLPWLEIACGGALLADVWTETSVFLIATMSLIFVLMLGQAVLRGLELNCGCFGSDEPGWFEQPIVALARACSLFAGAVWLLLETTEPKLTTQHDKTAIGISPSEGPRVP